jgi:hypothetical protein
MAKTRRLALAAGLLALLVVAALPAPQAQQAINRPPHAILGPDQLVGDSGWPCQPPGELQGCTRIDVDFSQSWDPDPRTRMDFVIAMSYEPSAARHVAQGGTGECAELIPWEEGEEDGQFYTYAPIIRSVQIKACIWHLRVTVRDGNQDQPAPNYCCTTDSLFIEIRNSNEAPRFDCNANGQCADSALVAELVDKGSGFVRRADTVDLVRDRGDTIRFTALFVQDDRFASAVDVYLEQVGANEEVLHRILVPMHKCGQPPVGRNDPACPDHLPLTGSLDQPCCNPPGAFEVSSWRGFLPVDTKSFVAGSYRVWARVSDEEGFRTDFADKEKVLIEVEGDGSCSPPCITLNKPVYLIPGFDPATQLAPSGCFPDAAPVADRYVFVLGHGESIRPVIQGPYPGEDEIDPATGLTYQFSDPNVLLWKVTYQVCRIIDGQVVKKPPTELDAPYYINLDTLFKGSQVEQELQLVAWDRLGRSTAVTINVIVDTSRPDYMVEAPTTTYQDIPFQMSVLVHDRIFSEVTMRIEDFDSGVDADHRMTAGLQAASGQVMVDNDPWLGRPGCDATQAQCPVGEASYTLLPRLEGAVGVDLDPDDGVPSPCAYVYDSDGNGSPDTVFDGTRMRILGEIVSKRSPKGPWNDHYVDVDGDGRAEDNEPMIPGTPQGGFEGVDLCLTPFSSPAVLHYLKAAETQVFSFNLTRRDLGVATYRFTIRDIAFNNFAAPSSTFTYPEGCKGPVCESHESTLLGRFATVRALIDAQVVYLNVTQGPYLPGDPVWFNTTVRQDTEQWPPPRAFLVVGVDEEARMQCAVDWRRALIGRDWVNATDLPPAHQTMLPLLFPGLDLTAAKVPNLALIPTACLVVGDAADPGHVAGCLPPAEANLTRPPLQTVRTKCVTVYPPTYSDLDRRINTLLGAPAERKDPDCPAPAGMEAVVCLVRPDRVLKDPELQLAFPPGRHTLAAYVQLAAQFNDTEEYAALAGTGMPNNYLASEPFEVFLGRVIVGSDPDDRGRATGRSQEIHIRAACPDAAPFTLPTCRGTPRVCDKDPEEERCDPRNKGGAVVLDAAGRVKESFELFAVNDPGTRYQFRLPDGTVAYWDPQARLEVDPSVCGLPDDSPQKCVRPITVVKPAKATTEPKSSPAPGLAVLLTLVVLAFAMGRRRT